MYGQMTAGSWIYIGTQGILQGTYETFAAMAAKRFGGTLAGTMTLTAGARRHGRRPAAGGDHERGRARSASRSTRRASSAAWRPATSTSSPTRVDDALDRRWRPSGAASPLSIARRSATRRSWCRSCSPAGPRSTSSPTRRRRTTRSCTSPAGSRWRRWRSCATSDPEGLTARAREVDGRPRRRHARLPRPRCRGLRLRQLHPGRGQARRLRPGLRLPGLRPRLRPAALLRGQGAVPVGRALRRPGRHRRHRPGRARRVPGQRGARRAGSAWPGRG